MRETSRRGDKMDLETRTKDQAASPEEDRALDSTTSEPMGFDSWAARPAPTKPQAHRDGFDFDAFKIFLILAALTAGMALVLRVLF